VVEGRRNGDFVTDARFSPDAATLATASLDGTARLWSAAGDVRRTLRPDDLSSIQSIAFSPDGSRLLVEQDSVSLWSAAGKLLRNFALGLGYATFSPDSALVGAADTDAVVLFDARSGRRVARLAVGSAHDKKTAVFTPAFSADGRLVAAPGAR